MADLTSSGVTVIRRWRENTVTGKDRVGMLVRITGGSYGSTGNKIPASAFGLTKIETCGAGTISTNAKVYPLVPSYDGSQILAMSLTDQTAVPADINLAAETLQFELHGY